MATTDNLISRREALRIAGLTAGATAFATPVVMGVFSTAASAQSACDPALDSEAIDLLSATDTTKWNTNCNTSVGQWGRYNAQKTTATIPGSGGVTAEIRFGFLGTDNFPVHCSFYQFVVEDSNGDPVPGWECSATFGVGKTTPDGCAANGWDGEFDSDPGNCFPPGPDPDFTPPVGALPVPYCTKNDSCPPPQFLHLTSFVCCPPA